MRPSMKLALIGGEVTLLAAFTGVGIHLAMQPHRVAFRPPPLVIPRLNPPPLLRATSTPTPAPAPAVNAPTPTATPFAPALFARFGEQDRNLLVQQWQILQQLTTAVERYVEARLTEQMERR
ncbi:MAG TPA: hypothetical protein VIT43_13880 [Candidatus Dormibacteraeota bacterium]